VREYLLVMLAATACCYLLAGLFRRVAVQTGMLAPVRDRDMHGRPTPYLGGVAMLFGVGVAFLLASRMPFLGRHEVVSKDSLGIFVAASVICIVGLIDDAIELPAIAKAAGQVLAAGLAVLFGVRMYWISLPNQIIALDQASSILITVIFIFICVNAVNFVDGLDGLAAGVVGIGASAMFFYTYVLAREQNLVIATTSSLVAVAITGACLGFLPHNFAKARMFMGDAGAMLLGLLLACSSLSLTGQIDAAALDPAGVGMMPSWMILLLPFAVMALPIFDMTLAYIRRTASGRWWFEADRRHLHHRLVAAGNSTVRAVLLMYLWTAVIAYGAVTVALLQSVWALLAWLIIAILVIGGTSVPMIQNARQQRTDQELITTTQQEPR